MSADPFLGRRNLGPFHCFDRLFSERAVRCLTHIRKGHANDRICDWVNVNPNFVQIIRHIDSPDTPALSHDEAVRYLAALIIWAGGMTSSEHHVTDNDGRGRIDLLAEIDGQLLVVEYKSGRLSRSSAAAAERQVLRYQAAIGSGLPLVVAERGGKPCPSVELLSLPEFAEPLRERALASIGELS